MGDQCEEIRILGENDGAELTTVTGWVSRNGYFYGAGEGAEHAARYEGATHVRCGAGCGEVIKAHRLRCDTCQSSYDRERWEKLTDEPWDGDTPVCQYMTDTYFFSLDEFLEHCECYEIDPGSVMLVHCEWTEPRELDAADFVCDYLPEDMECPEKIYEAAQVFNEALKKHWPQVCEPSNRRVSNCFDVKEDE